MAFLSPLTSSTHRLPWQLPNSQWANSAVPLSSISFPVFCSDFLSSRTHLHYSFLGLHSNPRRRIRRCCAGSPGPPPSPPPAPPPQSDPSPVKNPIRFTIIPQTGVTSSFSRFHDSIRIFFAVLFWLSLFFWSSAWDGRNGGRRNKGTRFRR
ncbi:hypothetical protein Ancab_012038 [Ancistrocladus abbreviatus]